MYVPSQLNLWLVVPLDKLRRELPRAQRGRQRRLNALHVRPQSVHDDSCEPYEYGAARSTFFFFKYGQKMALN